MIFFGFSILTVVVIFFFYLSFISHHLEVPFLWSMLLIYLYGKKHFYIAINSLFILILIFIADRLNFDPMSSKTEFAYSSVVLFITFLFVFIYQELGGKRFNIATIVSYVIGIILYSIPITYIIYAINFNTKITKDIIYAVSQTNVEESLEYTTQFISPGWLAVVLLSAIFMGYTLLKQEKKETSYIERSLLLFVIVLTFGIASMLKHDIRLYDFARNAAKNYQKDLRLFKEAQEKRKVDGTLFQADKNASGETYIVVIGESLNKKHMGVYGYLRDTTPRLTKLAKEEEIILFTNSYSSHTHTMQVLSLSLTEANQYNAKSYYDSISIMNILNKSNIDTYWLTNQALFGIYDNLVSIIAHEANHLIGMNRSTGTTSTQKLDGELIKEVKKILNTQTIRNRVIFVHLMGNHTSYKSRYPTDQYSIYQGKVNIGKFGTKVNKHSNINKYDNSIVYNDYVVSSILDELKKTKGVKGFIYMSDHSEDVIKRRGHNSGRFTFEMTQIPMIAWLSDEYKNRYSHKYENLLNHTETLFSNDMLYDTMIGLFGIETDRYNSKYDLTAENYSLQPNDALTLHGKKHYADRNNYIYWQKENTRYLIDVNQSSRVFPYGVDTVGKLHDIWNDGFRSFELNVRFGDENTEYFQILHDDEIIETNIEDFILSVDFSKINRVWLDVQNLNESNYKKALLRLDYLDQKYNLRGKLIIELGITGLPLNTIRKEGWHTSYSITTNNLGLVKEKDINKMRSLAKKIAERTVKQNLSAISFDHRLYPFVKEYLEPLISKDTVYYVTHGSSLADLGFKTKLLKNKIYLDKRVKVLSVPYKSQFEL